MSSEPKKISTACLDTVKFFSACIVAFFWHYQHFAPTDGSPFGSIFVFSYEYGWLMVELFFMLSGFGMMLGYGSKLLERSVSFSQYMRRRVSKLYPLFFLTLVLVTVLELVFKAKTGQTFVYPNFDLYHFFLNAVLCHDGLFVSDWSFNSPSWCISICFLLYILFYAVLTTSKSARAAVCKFACLGLVGSVILNLGWDYPVFNALVARGLFCFSIGVILAYAYRNSHRFHTKAVGYLCLLLLLGSYGLYRLMPSLVGDMHMLFILFLGPMLLTSAVYVPWLNRVLSLRALTWLGSLSMEIYLFHFPVQCAIKTLDLYCGLGLNYSSWQVWTVYTVSTLTVCVLYKLLLAKGVTKLFERISSRLLPV